MGTSRKSIRASSYRLRGLVYGRIFPGGCRRLLEVAVRTRSQKHYSENNYRQMQEDFHRFWFTEDNSYGQWP